MVEVADIGLRHTRSDGGCVKGRSEGSGKISSQIRKYLSRFLKRSAAVKKVESIVQRLHISGEYVCRIEVREVYRLIAPVVSEAPT